MRHAITMLAATVFIFTAGFAVAQSNLTQYVNPFIGTAPSGTSFGFYGNSGNVFPGAVCPRGMFQFSPDTIADLPGGYNYPDTSIDGFSVRHFSGRGIPCYLDFAFIPALGPVVTSPATSAATYYLGFAHTNETAAPGYYRVLLNNGVQVELTATKRTGLGRFTFPGTNAATILINAGSSITGTTTNTMLSIVGTNQVQGYATAPVGGGTQLYTVYFAAQFDRGFSSCGTWNSGIVTGGSLTTTGAQAGAWLTFDATTNPQVCVKAGISFVSLSNAVDNLNAENPGWNFAGIRNAADAQWSNVLNKVVVSGGATNQLQTFYTALYHCFFHPNIFNDANGQYRGMDGLVHTVPPGHSQYENIPAWDIYRSAIALMALLSPDEASDVAQSLVNDAQQGGGGMPRWQQANRNSGGMAGDGALPIIATAYALGATNFDAASALAAMDLNASTVSTASDGNLVRMGLSDYLSLGYVSGLASVTLEYCSDDFALAQFALALGDTGKYHTYLSRSGNWKNLFNNSTGLIQPRNADGSWAANVTTTTQTGYIEGCAAHYRWFVPFNLRNLLDALGGNASVITLLDNYFIRLNDGTGSPNAFMGNEPCEGNPWIYDYAGAPAKTQNTVRRIQSQLYNNTPAGLPGNDDAGSLSSWYVFSALGFYPLIPGVGGFVVGSPVFTNATINLSNGHQINIQASQASAANCYVQNLSLNGSNTSQLWLPFSTIQNGASLVFDLAASPSSWGTANTNAPPSFDANGTVQASLSIPNLTYFFEAESLAVPDISPGFTNRVASDNNYSGGYGVILDATNVNEYLTFLVPNLATGQYEVRVAIKQLNTRGIWQLAIGQAGNFAATAANVGAPLDEYAPGPAYTEINLGTWTCLTAGDKWFQFKIAGKNPSSTGYLEAFDYLKLTSTPLLMLGANVSADRRQLVFNWPAWAANAQLCSATNLTPPIQWSPITNAPAVSNGINSLAVPVTAGPPQYFRLQPQ